MRKYTSQASYEYYENGAGDVESRQATGRFNVELNNSDIFNVEANANYDLLLTPFSPAPVTSIPVGGYHYNDVLMSYNMGQQRRLSGNIGVQLGEYYNGTIRALTFSQGRYAILKQFSVEPRVSINHIELPNGAFTTRLFGARTDYGFSPAHVRERAAAVQLGRSHLQQQRAVSLGIPARKRVFRGLDG